jgi:hypothetical protein
MLPFPSQFGGGYAPRFPQRIPVPQLPQFGGGGMMNPAAAAFGRNIPGGFGAPVGPSPMMGGFRPPAAPGFPQVPALAGMGGVPALPNVPALGGMQGAGGGLGSSPAAAWANAMKMAPAGIDQSLIPNPFGGGGGAPASVGGAPAGPTGSVPGTAPGSLSPAPSPGSAVHPGTQAPAPTSSTGAGGAFDQYVAKQNGGSKTFDMPAYKDKLTAWHDELMSSLQTYLDALQGYNPMSSGTRPENPLSSLMEGRPNVRDFWSTPKAKTNSAPTNARTF